MRYKEWGGRIFFLPTRFHSNVAQSDVSVFKKQDFTFGTILTNHFGKRNFLRRFG